MYIVFEGIVGSGKTTQTRMLATFLREKYPNREVIVIREPGSTPIAEDIRSLAQGKEWNEMMHPLTNSYLYAAARAQTIQTIVAPHLVAGNIVVSDRSFVSSLAQQGYAQGVGIDCVLSLNEAAIGGILPDIIFYMDMPVNLATQRVNNHMEDKWEKMDITFFEKVIEGYEICSKLPLLRDRYIRIDACGSEQQVHARILGHL